MHFSAPVVASQCRCRSSCVSSESLGPSVSNVDPGPSGDQHNAATMTRSGAELGGPSNSSWFSWPKRGSTGSVASRWSVHSSFGFGGSQEEQGEPCVGRVRVVKGGCEPGSPSRARRMSSFHLLEDPPDKLDVAETSVPAHTFVKSEKERGRRGFSCEFVGEDGAKEMGLVEVVHAPIKTVTRMREKLGASLRWRTNATPTHSNSRMILAQCMQTYTNQGFVIHQIWLQ